NASLSLRSAQTGGISRKPRKSLKAKLDPKLAIWTKAVKERDSNQCQAQRFSGRNAYEFTGLRCFGPLDAHHMFTRGRRPDKKYDVDAGIALCRVHHDWVGNHPIEAEALG